MLLVGLPGSGKTTYGAKMVKAHPDIVHLSSDKIRKWLWGDESTQGDPNEVFSLMQQRAVEALNDGKDVIYDSTAMTRKDRAGIIAACPKFAKIECHIIWAPIETCIERDAARERTVGKEVIDRMLKRFQAPYYDEGFDNIYVSYPVSFDHYAYFTKLVDAMKIPHDNPHHSLDVFEHCAEAAEYIEQKGCDHNMFLAAALHDVGKPYVKSFTDSKNNPCDTAHFYQHQCVGCWQYYGTRAALMQLDDIEVARLISTHMDPYLNTKYYNRLPPYLKSQVDLLHEADRQAH
jgi:predicted kinase